MRPFKAARAFVRKLKLKSVKEWREWCKSGMRPANIPGNPNTMYGGEFISYPDFLGYAPKRGAGGSRSSSASSSSSSSSAASTGPKKSKKRKHGPTTAASSGPTAVVQGSGPTAVVQGFLEALSDICARPQEHAIGDEGAGGCSASDLTDTVVSC